MSFDSIYTGMSGLTTFEGALKVISNNIANMNSAGFKGSTLQFSDLLPQQGFVGSEGGQHPGNGVMMMPPLMDLSEGGIQKTGNTLDAAISGPGFFVSRKDGAVHYSRNGQFLVDDEGYLVSRGSGFRVAALGEGGALTDISVEDYRTFPPQQTTKIDFQLNLHPSQAKFTLENVKLIDALGGSRLLKMEFEKITTPPPPGVTIEWKVTVLDGVTQVGTLTLAYVNAGLANSAPKQPTQVLIGTLKDGQSVSVMLDFNGTTSQADNFTSTSTFKFESSDGKATGSLTGQSIDADGFIVFAYSNEETKKGPQLALAEFGATRALEQVGAGDFIATEAAEPVYVVASTNGSNTIKPGEIEQSNVDVSEAFGALIMAQRAYQSASRVVTTANQMLEDLLNVKGGR